MHGDKTAFLKAGVPGLKTLSLDYVINVNSGLQSQSRRAKGNQLANRPILQGTIDEI